MTCSVSLSHIKNWWNCKDTFLLSHSYWVCSLQDNMITLICTGAHGSVHVHDVCYTLTQRSNNTAYELMGVFTGIVEYHHWKKQTSLWNCFPFFFFLFSFNLSFLLEELQPKVTSVDKTCKKNLLHLRHNLSYFQSMWTSSKVNIRSSRPSKSKV